MKIENWLIRTLRPVNLFYSVAATMPRLSISTGEKKPKGLPDSAMEALSLDPVFLRRQGEALTSEGAAKKAQMTREQKAREKFSRFVKFGVVLWAIRAGFMGIGFGVGGNRGMWWRGNFRFYMSAVFVPILFGVPFLLHFSSGNREL